MISWDLEPTVPTEDEEDVSENMAYPCIPANGNFEREKKHDDNKSLDF